MTHEDFEILLRMDKYGGSFVRALAEAAQHADPVNFQKLKTTFADYWEDYSYEKTDGLTK